MEVCVGHSYLAVSDWQVETPLMSASVGGAVARPFVTKSLALNQDFFLRISPELYLKVIVLVLVLSCDDAANNCWWDKQGV